MIVPHNLPQWEILLPYNLLKSFCSIFHYLCPNTIKMHYNTNKLSYVYNLTEDIAITNNFFFQNTLLVNLTEIRHLRDEKALELPGISKYQSGDNELDREQNRFPMEDGKGNRKEGRRNHPYAANPHRVMVPLYHFKSSGRTCILFTVDAILSLKHLNAYHHLQVRDTYLPYWPGVTGDCNKENEQKLTLSWETFLLTWHFIKLPDKGKWFISNIELKLEPSELFFDFANYEDQSYTLSLATSNNDPVISAPIGKSFICADREIGVNLSSPQINIVASLFMRRLILTPFADGDKFTEDYVCPTIKSAGKCQNELLAVNCWLAVTCVVFKYVSL